MHTPWYGAAVAGTAAALLLGTCGGAHDSAGPSASTNPASPASATPSTTNPYGAGPIDFSGVSLATVMATAGIPDTATVETVALNDYHYSSPIGPMVDSLALIATNGTAHRFPMTRAVRSPSCFPTALRCRRTSTPGTGASRRSR